DEDAATATVNPQAAAIDAPGLAFDAAGLRGLTQQIRGSPIGTAARESIIVARALNTVIAPVMATVVAALWLGLCRRHQQRRTEYSYAHRNQFAQHALSPVIVARAV